MTYGYPAPTGGDGATAFTDLTDAPETITPKAMLVGNEDGTAVQWTTETYLQSFQDIPGISTATASLYMSAARNDDYDSPEADVLTSSVVLGEEAVSTVKVQAFGAEESARLSITAFTNATDHTGTVLFDRLGGDFAMQGFDTPATDTNARLTVDGTSYAIDKAIQVKIGADTRYWPLYGGADAGPAPAPSIVETIVPNAVVIGNAAGDALVMSAAITVTEAGVISIATDNAPAGDANDIHITGGDSVDGKGASVLLTAGAGTGETNPGSVTLEGKVTIQSTTQDLTITSHVTHLLSPAGVSVESDQLNVAAGSIHLDSTGDLRLKADDEAGITIDTPYTEIQTNTLSIYPNTGSDFAAPNNGQAVTFGTDIGPGGAAVSIKRWIPITVDGNEGWIAHFGV